MALRYQTMQLPRLYFLGVRKAKLSAGSSCNRLRFPTVYVKKSFFLLLFFNVVMRLSGVISASQINALSTQ